MENVINFLGEHWEAITAFILWVFVRLVPTKKNYDLIEGVLKMIGRLIPNKKKPLLCLIFFLFAFGGAFAQLNYNARSVRYVCCQDTTTFSPAPIGTVLQATDSALYVKAKTGFWVPVGGAQDTTYLPFVYPETFGAVGNGSTDDATAIQTAIDTGLPVYFSKKNYRVNSPINIPDSAYIQGSGQHSIVSTTSNIAIFSIQGKGSTFKSISLQGNDTGTSQVGISSIGNAGFTLERNNTKLIDCNFYDFGGSGIYSQYVRDGLTGNHTGLGAFQATNCFFYSSRYGIDLALQSEYSNFVNCGVVACTVGLNWMGGNNTFDSGQISGCTLAVNLMAGTNDGHGIISNSKINHNTTFLNASGITLGMLFADNMIYANSTMSVSNCVELRFIGNDFSQPGTWTITNSNNWYIDNKFFTNPTFSISGAASPIFFNNFFKSGTIPTEVTNTISAPLQLTPTATRAGLNFGSLAGNPSALINADVWYNTSTGKMMAREGGATLPLIDNLNSTYLGYGSTSNFLTGEASLTYDATLNQILLAGTSGTTATSVFGGEIQLDDVSASDDLTINNSGIISTGNAAFEIGTATGDLNLTHAGGDLVVDAVGELSAGSYTPTVTVNSNASGAGAQTHYYMRVGNIVNVSGSIAFTNTTSGASTTLRVTLPVASNFGSTNECAGGGAARDNAGAGSPANVPVRIDADSANDEASLNFVLNVSAAACTVRYSFQYVIL